MTVHNNSRYRGEPTQLVDTADKGRQLAIYRQPVFASAQYIQYAAVEGDSFPLLADRLWGDPQMWWVIADLNPHVFFPGKLNPGTFLRIPMGSL